MKVKVRLFGALRLHVFDYDPSEGLLVEIPPGAAVKDLLAHLGISETRGAVVIAQGRTMEANDKLRDGEPVDVFQTIRGGC